ncbi:MAG TPA: HU family DNA-binding protein, partial [Candidatus Binataceae bacterium]|nr:HU family DNA-binding protein [Candidatus Binataceae bacterium]
IDELSVRHPTISVRDSQNVVTAMFEEMARELTTGQRIELRGFGSFAVKLRRARRGRNPKTGAGVDVAARLTPFFRTGKELRVKLNGSVPGAREAEV